MISVDVLTLYMIHSLVSALICAALAVYLFIHRRVSGARQLMALMIAVGQWALTYALEFRSTTLAAKLFWVRLEYFGGAWTGFFVLLFVLFITGHEDWATRTRLAVLAVVPSVTPLLALTNDWHHLMWRQAWLEGGGPATIMVYHRGPGFWIFIGVSYLMILAASIILVRSYLMSRHLYRKQLGVILFGIAAPWLSNAIYLFELGPFQHLDLTPVAFTFSGLAFAWGLFRYQMLDLVPMAREAVLDAMEDAVFVLDVNDRIIDLNPAAARLTDRPSETVMGKPMKRLPSLFTPIESHRNNSTVPAEIELDGQGGPRIYDLRGSPLFDRHGRPGGWLAIFQDITERKRAEREQEKLRAQLQHAQKMEAIGTLAGGVAHDLNNILSGIVTYPDLILMQLPADSPLRKPIATMQASGQKAAATVQDLLTLARRGVTVNEVVDLNAVVSAYLASPEHQALMGHHPRVRVAVRIEPNLDNIMGSAVHLSKAIMNLVANGAEAMPEGGCLVLSTENRRVDRPIRGFDEVCPGEYVILRVADEGTGISPADRVRIFDPFYTRKVMGRSGTGLGMSVVWGTVKDHQGHIDLETRLGKGTRFTLYFPMTRKPVLEPREPQPFSHMQGRGETILVVDDEPHQRDIAGEMLTALNYAVITVPSGEAAVDWVKSHRADLIIMDMIMAPGMDGTETCKSIWMHRPGQRIIIASGYSETQRVLDAQQLGAGRYIRKPYALETLGMAVRDALSEPPPAERVASGGPP
ncbi:MAG: response regulator [Desulfobacterales bacterium]|nr:response regulator [Desulfobacterales bacterium]